MTRWSEQRKDSVKKLSAGGEKLPCGISKDRLCNYNFELRNARQSFSDIITINNNNTHTLFATVDRHRCQ